MSSVWLLHICNLCSIKSLGAVGWGTRTRSRDRNVLNDIYSTTFGCPKDVVDMALVLES